MRTRLIRYIGILKSLEIIENVQYVFAGCRLVLERTHKAKRADFNVFITRDTNVCYIHASFL